MQGVGHAAHPKREQQMEKLTTEQIKQFSNTTFGREIGKQRGEFYVRVFENRFINTL